MRKLTFSMALIGAVMLLGSCKKGIVPTDSMGEGAQSKTTLGTTAVTLQVYPADVKQQITNYGTDTKLNVNKFLQASDKTALANYLVNDIHMSVMRIPIIAWKQEIVEGQPDFTIYNDLLTVMSYIKAAKPSIKFFASPAEDDANENGGQEYPSWLGPDNSFNHQKYGRLIADYLKYMKTQGYDIEYVGPFNEDSAFGVTNFHNVKVGISQNIGTTVTMPKLIGPDRWGIEKSVEFANSINASGYASDFSILGSHFYDDDTMAAKWAEFTAAATTLSKNVWFTEATRYGTASGIDGLLNGILQMWEPLKAGVNGVIVYQGVNQLIKVNSAGAITLDEDYYGFKSFANNTINKNRIGTIGAGNVKLMAFKNTSTNNYMVIALNPNTTDELGATFKINGVTFAGNISQNIWTSASGATGTSSSFAGSGNTFIRDIPARSLSVFTFTAN